jgi:hypothetical protein
MRTARPLSTSAGALLFRLHSLLTPQMSLIRAGGRAAARAARLARVGCDSGWNTASAD